MRMSFKRYLLSWLLGFVSKTVDGSLMLVSFGPGLAGDLAVIHMRFPHNNVKVHKAERQIIKLQEGFKHFKKKLPPCYLCSFVYVLGSSVVFLSLAT